MKNINLWVNGEGWQPFDLDGEAIEAELLKRGIKISAGSRASIGDDAKPKCLYIAGSIWLVSYWGEDKVQVGCQQRTVAKWRKTWKKEAEGRRLTPEQVEEYGRYMDLVEAFHAANATPITAQNPVV